MQDPDVPPVVVEGETGGAEDGVRRTAVVNPQGASVNRWQVEFTALPWTTATAPHSTAATTMEPKTDASAPDSPRLIRSLIQSLYHNWMRAPVLASSPLWMTYFSRPRFRKRRAS